MKKRITYLAYLVLIIFLIDIILGYFFVPEYSQATDGFLCLHPYYNHGYEKNKSGEVSYGNLHPVYFSNSLGMKDSRIRNVAPQSEKHRILLIGDSFTDGVGYTYDSTFCGRLMAMLDTNHMEILNAAVPSYSPKLYYLKVNYLLNIEHVKVNEIYCLLDFSDVFDELVYEPFVPLKPTFSSEIIYSVQKFYRQHSAIYYVYTNLAMDAFARENRLTPDLSFIYWMKTNNNFSKEADYRFPDYRGEWPMPDKINKPVTKRAISLTQNNLLKLRDLCVNNKIKFHLVIYPEASQLYRSDPIINHVYRSVWRDFSLKYSIDFIDLNPLFIGENKEINFENEKRYYIPGDSHWNAAGHKRVADSLYRIIN